MRKTPSPAMHAQKNSNIGRQLRVRGPLRKISAELAAAGFVNKSGKPCHAQSIQRMVEGARPVSAAQALPLRGDDCCPLDPIQSALGVRHAP